MAIKRVQTTKKVRQSVEYWESNTDAYILIGRREPNAETDEMEFVPLPGYFKLDPEFKNKVFGQGQYQEIKLQGNALQDEVIKIAKENLELGEKCFLDDFEVMLVRKQPNQEEIYQHRERNIKFTKVSK
jgi:hypothetical protein